MMPESHRIFRRLQSRQLPVLPPPAVHTLLAAFADDTLNWRQMAAILEHFPTIVARLISLANSAWSAPIKKITALEHACARLGMGVVRSTSIALAVSAPFNPRRCPQFDVEYYWTRALAVADTSARLAELVLDSENAQTARTAGLLHNLGLLWMAHGLPRETARAIQITNSDTEASLDETLSNLVGAGYREAGGYLARRWQLPEPIPAALEQEPDNGQRVEGWQTVVLVGLAISMVKAAESGATWPMEKNQLFRLGIHPQAARQVFLSVGRQLQLIQGLAAALSSH